jgi:hypothetical protein
MTCLRVWVEILHGNEDLASITNFIDPYVNKGTVQPIMESRNNRQVARASQLKVGSRGHHEKAVVVM